MTLADEYRRQWEWRRLPSILDELEPLAGQRVLDLGCGAGDVARELGARGARVVAIDGQRELLTGARARCGGASFLQADLRRLPLGDGAAFDGLWCSFAAAYFPSLSERLEDWGGRLRAGGWIALTEVDDLFGHEPLSERTRAILRAYADDALAAGRYDFQMGRKLRAHLEGAGFDVVGERELDDGELSFPGPAPAPVLEIWRDRLDRMRFLHEHCGASWEDVRAELLAALAHGGHRSLARVRCCIARARS